VQEWAAQEVADLARMRTGLIFKFSDIWRMKAVLVAGKPGEVCRVVETVGQPSPHGKKRIPS